MNDSMMKADRRGRLRYSPEQKAALISAYQSSGLSGPRFAALHGVNYQTLAGWLQKRKRVTSQDSHSPPHPSFLSLIPAEIHGADSSSSTGPMEILLPGGSKIVLTAHSQVRLAAALIRELEKKQPC